SDEIQVMKKRAERSQHEHEEMETRAVKAEQKLRMEIEINRDVEGELVKLKESHSLLEKEKVTLEEEVVQWKKTTHTLKRVCTFITACTLTPLPPSKFLSIPL